MLPCTVFPDSISNMLPLTWMWVTSQAAPSNAIFFLCYDALNAMGTTALLASGAAGVAGSSLPSTALHLGASSIATVPSNLVRTPAEVVKQRLQVCHKEGEMERERERENTSSRVWYMMESTG